METKHLCSAANTWSLGFCSPSPKKRSGERAHQVCKAQQRFRTGTKSTISRGSHTTWACEVLSWLRATRPLCRWRRHEILRNHTWAEPMLCGVSERWDFLRLAFLTTGLNCFSFYIEEIWEPQWSWVPPAVVFNTVICMGSFSIPLWTNCYFISLSSQPKKWEYQIKKINLWALNQTEYRS